LGAFRGALERDQCGIGYLKIVRRTVKEALIAVGHPSRVNAEREWSGRLGIDFGHSLLLHFLLNVSGAFAVNINEQ